MASRHGRAAYGFALQQGYMKDPVAFSLMHCQAWYNEFDPIVGASVKANNLAVLELAGERRGAWGWGGGGGWGVRVRGWC